MLEITTAKARKRKKSYHSQTCRLDYPKYSKNFEEEASNISENRTAIVGSDSECTITDLGDSNYTASEFSDSKPTVTDKNDRE